MENIAIRWITTAVMVLMSAGIAGCHKDIKDYCEAVTKCEGGNDNDEKACVEWIKAEREAAKEYDCKDEYDDEMACIVDNAKCEGDYYAVNGTDCDGDSNKYDSCIEKNSALN